MTSAEADGLPPIGDKNEPEVRDEAIHLDLHAEELIVSRHRVDTIVKVSRTTKLVEKTINELLSDSQVVVERVPVGIVVDVMPPVREEGDTTVFPVVEEILVTERRLFLREEVHVRKVNATRQHVEAATLREQSVAVSRSTKDAV